MTSLPSILHLVSCSLLLLVTPLHGRVGEDLAQCSARYGRSTFQNDDGEFGFRRYALGDKRILAVFFKGTSVMEQISWGPRPSRSRNEALDVTGEWISFCQGVLADAYRFSDEQLQDLQRKKLSPNKVEFGPADNEDVRAFWIGQDMNDETVLFTLLILNRPVYATHLQRFSEFWDRSLAREASTRRAKQTTGF